MGGMPPPITPAVEGRDRRFPEQVNVTIISSSRLIFKEKIEELLRMSPDIYLEPHTCAIMYMPKKKKKKAHLPVKNRKEKNQIAVCVSEGKGRGKVTHADLPSSWVCARPQASVGHPSQEFLKGPMVVGET